MLRKVAVAAASNPKVEIRQTGEQFYIKTSTSVRTTEIDFHIGEEFDEETVDGRKCKHEVNPNIASSVTSEEEPHKSPAAKRRVSSSLLENLLGSAFSDQTQQQPKSAHVRAEKKVNKTVVLKHPLSQKTPCTGGTRIKCCILWYLSWRRGTCAFLGLVSLQRECSLLQET